MADSSRDSTFSKAQIWKKYKTEQADSDDNEESLDVEQLRSEVRHVFADGGIFSSKLKNYSPRQGQIELADTVAQGLGDNKQILMVEAGTGTGKTFSYLVPPILANKRVIVSTGTKALQDQLVEKDIPNLLKILGREDLMFMGLKGHSNYICRLMVDDVSAQDFGYADLDHLNDYVDSCVGEMSDFFDHKVSGVAPNFAETKIKMREDQRRLVTCDSMSCHKRRKDCPYVRQPKSKDPFTIEDECFITAARKLAQQCGVITINHALFFASLGVSRPVFTNPQGTQGDNPNANANTVASGTQGGEQSSGQNKRAPTGKIYFVHPSEILQTVSKALAPPRDEFEVPLSNVSSEEELTEENKLDSSESDKSHGSIKVQDIMAILRQQNALDAQEAGSGVDSSHQDPAASAQSSSEMQNALSMQPATTLFAPVQQTVQTASQVAPTVTAPQTMPDPQGATRAWGKEFHSAEVTFDSLSSLAQHKNHSTQSGDTASSATFAQDAESEMLPADAASTAPASKTKAKAKKKKGHSSASDSHEDSLASSNVVASEGNQASGVTPTTKNKSKSHSGKRKGSVQEPEVEVISHRPAHYVDIMPDDDMFGSLDPSGLGEVNENSDRVMNLLPKPEVLVFDEAHTVPEVGRSFYTRSYNRNQLKDFVKDLKAELNEIPNYIATPEVNDAFHSIGASIDDLDRTFCVLPVRRYDILEFKYLHADGINYVKVQKDLVDTLGVEIADVGGAAMFNSLQGQKAESTTSTTQGAGAGKKDYKNHRLANCNVLVAQDKVNLPLPHIPCLVSLEPLPLTTQAVEGVAYPQYLLSLNESIDYEVNDDEEQLVPLVAPKKPKRKHYLDEQLDELEYIGTHTNKDGYTNISLLRRQFRQQQQDQLDLEAQEYSKLTEAYNEAQHELQTKGYVDNPEVLEIFRAQRLKEEMKERQKQEQQYKGTPNFAITFSDPHEQHFSAGENSFNQGAQGGPQGGAMGNGSADGAGNGGNNGDFPFPPYGQPLSRAQSQGNQGAQSPQGQYGASSLQDQPSFGAPNNGSQGQRQGAWPAPQPHYAQGAPYSQGQAQAYHGQGYPQASAQYSGYAPTYAQPQSHGYQPHGMGQAPQYMGNMPQGMMQAPQGNSAYAPPYGQAQGAPQHNGPQQSDLGIPPSNAYATAQQGGYGQHGNYGFNQGQGNVTPFNSGHGHNGFTPNNYAGNAPVSLNNSQPSYSGHQYNAGATSSQVQKQHSRQGTMPYNHGQQGVDPRYGKRKEYVNPNFVQSSQAQGGYSSPYQGSASSRAQYQGGAYGATSRSSHSFAQGRKEYVNPNYVNQNYVPAAQPYHLGQGGHGNVHQGSLEPLGVPVPQGLNGEQERLALQGRMGGFTSSQQGYNQPSTGQQGVASAPQGLPQGQNAFAQSNVKGQYGSLSAQSGTQGARGHGQYQAFNYQERQGIQGVQDTPSAQEAQPQGAKREGKARVKNTSGGQYPQAGTESTVERRDIPLIKAKDVALSSSWKGQQSFIESQKQGVKARSSKSSSSKSATNKDTGSLFKTPSTTSAYSSKDYKSSSTALGSGVGVSASNSKFGKSKYEEPVVEYVLDNYGNPMFNMDFRFILVRMAKSLHTIKVFVEGLRDKDNDTEVNNAQTFIDNMLNFITDLMTTDRDKYGNLRDEFVAWVMVKDPHQHHHEEYSEEIEARLQYNEMQRQAERAKAGKSLHEEPKENDFEITLAPIEIGRFLGPELKRLTQSGISVIFASATITTSKDFSKFCYDLGLNLEDVATKIVDSPFNYSKNARIMYSKEFLDISVPDRMLKHVKKLKPVIDASPGGVFFLTTSYASLKEAEQACVKLFGETRNIYVQNRDSVANLMDAFRSDGHGILLGTSSFWEGVDVPGQALSLVIIDKLPFKIANDPVNKARSAIFERMGKNPFYAISVPEAIIKLRQGVGRLIRNEKDLGALIILDPRIETKRYGAEFIASLPPMTRVSKLEDIIAFFDHIKEQQRQGLI